MLRPWSCSAPSTAKSDYLGIREQYFGVLSEACTLTRSSKFAPRDSLPFAPPNVRIRSSKSRTPLPHRFLCVLRRSEGP